MPIHDGYARITPFELGFRGGEGAEEWFPPIRRELEARGLEAVDPDAFLALPAAMRVLGEIMDPEAGPAALREYGALLHHAYHFWRHGQPLFLLDTAVARHLVEAAPDLDGWDAAALAPAGYVQLPQYLFWARVLERGPVEAVDGFFWSAAGKGRIAALLVLGMRGDRPGITAVPLGPLGPDELRELADMPVREVGRDFESTLPGGEIERLYSLETEGEALKLVVRAVWYLARFPARLQEEPSAEGGRGGPPPSRLPYRRVVMEERSGA